MLATPTTHPHNKENNATAVLIGDFTPLTLAHLDAIHHAGGMVDSLHIIACTPSHRPLPSGRTASLADSVRWLQNACQHYPFVQVHTWTSLGVDQLPMALQDVDYQCFGRQTLGNQTAIDELQNLLTDKLACENPLIFVKSGGALTHSALRTLPAHPSDDLPITDKPLAYFDKLHPACRYFYTQTVCIVGGESSGKTTLLHKLANHYGATVALEMGRLYTHTHLGGTELALQYSDYTPIAIQHAAAIDTARQTASAAVTLIDTDFATTQAFCEVYEKHTHPAVAALALDVRMDLTIYLDNNVAWVADGMRRLGGSARSAFATHLLDVLKRYQIDIHSIDHPDYHARYLQAVALIDEYLSSH